MRAPFHAGSGFRIVSAKEGLAFCDECGWSGESHLRTDAGPLHALRTAGSMDGDRRFPAAIRHNSGRGGAGPGAGRSGRANTAFEDANLHIVGADHTHEDDVRLPGKLPVKANLAAQFLPAASVRTKILVVHHDDEMRIAHRDLD